MNPAPVFTLEDLQNTVTQAGSNLGTAAWIGLAILVVMGIVVWKS